MKKVEGEKAMGGTIDDAADYARWAQGKGKPRRKKMTCPKCGREYTAVEGVDDDECWGCFVKRHLAQGLPLGAESGDEVRQVRR